MVDVTRPCKLEYRNASMFRTRIRFSFLDIGIMVRCGHWIGPALRKKPRVDSVWWVSYDEIEKTILKLD